MLIGYKVSCWDDENVLELDRHGTTECAKGYY